VAPRQRVVVVGAGFGGLNATKALRSLDVETLLIERHNFHLFQPLLYQVATGLLDPSQIAYPVRAAVRRARNARVLMATVTAVELDEHLLRTTAGDVSYDVLVLATGSTSNYFGMHELEQRATGLKTLGEAVHIRSTILAALEQATRAADAETRRRWLAFTVAGGGPTGVEMAGAIAELLRHVLPRDYPRLALEDASVTLLEARDQLLATFAPRLGRIAVKTLRRKGVTLLLGREVRGVDEGAVVLHDGTRVDAATLIWTAGVQAAAPSGLDALIRGRSCRIPVTPSLTVPDHPEVFVIGDLAELPYRGEPLPMLAPVAIQQGRHVAAVLTARRRGDPEPPFRYVDKGNMATIGRGAAVAQLGPVHVDGFTGWLMWLALHLVYIAGFRNRAVVIISWAWNFFFFDRSVRLILEPERNSRGKEET